MYAKYIKREVADLNGTGRTQACYKMELKPMTFQQFVSLCHREGGMDESMILGVLSLVSEKLALCMAEGFSVKLDGIAHAFDSLNECLQIGLHGRLAAGNGDALKPSLAAFEKLEEFLLGNDRRFLRMQHQPAVLAERAPEVTAARKNGARKVLRKIKQCQFLQSVYLHIRYAGIMLPDGPLFFLSRVRASAGRTPAESRCRAPSGRLL